jgi:hypothetical protein
MLANILLAAALLTTPDSPGAQSHVLTTSELEAVLPGSWIIDTEIPYSFCCYPEMFYSRGEYVRHADNYEAHGTYRISDNRVCVVAEREEELCRLVMVDAKGQYWISKKHSPQSFRRITINKLD